MRRFLKPLLAVLIFCILQACSGVVLALWGIKTQEAMAGHSTLLALSIIVSGVLTVCILYALKMFPPRVLNHRRINWEYAHLGVIGAIMGIIATDLLSELLDLPDLMQTQFIGLARNPLGILAIAVIGPIVEEVVFRACVLGHLLRHGVGRWTAIIVSALVFGVVHFNPAQIPFAVIIGVLLGIVYAKSHSILLTCFIHILNNSIAVAEMYKLGEKIDEFSLTSVFGMAPTLAFIAISGVLCIVFMREFMRKYHRNHLSSRRRHH